VSFILDALRKSEHERQRSTVPGLTHVPLATAPAPLPRWAIAAIAALGVAVLVLAGAWWQSTRSTDASTAPPQAVRSVTLPPPTAVPETAATAPRPAASERGQVAGSLATAATTESGAATPADTAPPSSTLSLSLPAAAAPTRAGADDAIPTAAALSAQGVALPPLRLELHAFSERPSERYVFINGRKYVEGERLPEGTQLVSITPVGAVLSQYGQRFLLVPE
jgi:general secretion pathway protein B